MAKRLISVFIIIYLLAVASNCATMPQQKDLESSLKQAAKKYWDIRLKGSLKDIYDMEYREGLPPMDEYLLRAALIRKFIITKHRIKELVVEGKNGTVFLELYIMMPVVSKPFKQTLNDLWIWDGRWKHILNPQEFLKRKNINDADAVKSQKSD